MIIGMILGIIINISLGIIKENKEITNITTTKSLSYMIQEMHKKTNEKEVSNILVTSHSWEKLSHKECLLQIQPRALINTLIS